MGGNSLHRGMWLANSCGGRGGDHLLQWCNDRKVTPVLVKKFPFVLMQATPIKPSDSRAKTWKWEEGFLEGRRVPVKGAQGSGPERD